LLNRTTVLASPPRGFIFQLSRPLDFDAIDEAPGDLIFLLVFGEEWRSEYLKVLAHDRPNAPGNQSHPARMGERLPVPEPGTYLPISIGMSAKGSGSGCGGNVPRRMGAIW